MCACPSASSHPSNRALGYTHAFPLLPPSHHPQSPNDELLDHLAHWISDESTDKLKAPLDTSDWSRESPGNNVVPQQYNGVDCGVFTIM